MCGPDDVLVQSGPKELASNIGTWDLYLKTVFKKKKIKSLILQYNQPLFLLTCTKVLFQQFQPDGSVNTHLGHVLVAWPNGLYDFYV